MKAENILLLILTIGMLGCYTAQANYTIFTDNTTSTVLTQEQPKYINISGVIVQTINKAKETCFQVIETAKTPQGRPGYSLSDKQERFIVCKNKYLDSIKYDHRLITVSGEVVSYYSSPKKDVKIPRIDAFTIKLWPKYRSKSHHAFANGVYFSGKYKPKTSYGSVNSD